MTEPTRTIDVWPGLVPGEQTHEIGKSERSDDVTRLSDVTRPQLLFFPAPGNGPHPTVIVCPGGGYYILALDLEGIEIALWLNGLGFTAAVLTYRVPNNRDAAFADGQKAILLLRSQASELGIDPQHIGIMGFSAGGHLCARLAAAENPESRPDFAALVYPAFLLDDARLPVSEVKPHAAMPPMFLAQTDDDCHLCAPTYAAALEAVGVPARTAFYALGGHGYGVRSPEDTPVYGWVQEAAAWLRKVTAHDAGGK